MASDSGPNAMCETGGFDVGPVTLAIRPGIGNSEAHNTEDMTHSELVMLDEIGDNYRVGVGLSIVETLLVAIERLKNDSIRLLLEQDRFEMVTAEATELMVSLKILADGRNYQTGDDYSDVGAGSPHTQKASQALHVWLLKVESPLRGVLSALSSDRAFYEASIAVEMARAWVAQLKIPEENVSTTASVRSSGDAAEWENDD